MEINCQLDATEVFIADLIACSTCFGHHYAYHQELKSIIQWLLRVVFRAVVFKLLVWCGAEGYVSGLQDAAVCWCVVWWCVVWWCIVWWCVVWWCVVWWCIVWWCIVWSTNKNRGYCLWGEVTVVFCCENMIFVCLTG